MSSIQTEGHIKEHFKICNIGPLIGQQDLVTGTSSSGVVAFHLTTDLIKALITY